MANYEVLEPGGHAALVDGLKDYADREGGVGAEQIADGSVGMDKLDEDVLDTLDLKADIDGYYAQLTAGAADNLTSRGDAVAASYLYRTSGGTADIETGQAAIRSIKGNTLRWNQLSTGVNDRQTIDGLTFSQSETGGLNVSGTITTAPSNSRMYISNTLTVKRDGRKYLCMLSKDIGIDIFLTGFTVSNQRRAFIFSNNYDGEMIQTAIAIVVNDGDTLNLSDVHASIFDLTQMFGAGNEPSTVAEFEALFPLPYYEYDAGSLLSVNMEGIETVGFNLWDGTFESSTLHYLAVDGSFVSNSSWYVTDYIECVGGQQYYVKGYKGSEPAVCWYDANKQFIAGVKYGSDGLGSSNGVFTVPSNACYLRASVNNDVRREFGINLSWSGRRNGEYEAYWSSQRLIDVAMYFPDGMRSAGTVRDELTSTEAITRVGVVDLGTLTWNYDVSGCFAAVVSGKAVGFNNFVCSKYETASTANVANLQDKYIVGGTGSSAVYVKDTAYGTDVNAFKTAMDGVLLFYAIATPIVTPIDPALNLSYRVDDWGTERVLVPTGEMSAPPVMEVAYGLNVVDFVRRAPTQYISHDSHGNFVDALEGELGVTVTETFDATDNAYEYSIAPTDGMTLAQAKENLRGLLDLVQGTIGSVTDWSEIAEMASHGSSFLVGTQFQSTYKSAADGTEYEMPWDVMHFETATVKGGSSVAGVYLESHYALPFATMFDQIEAFYAVPSGGLAAGTYSVTFGNTSAWGQVPANSTYSFTLANSYSQGAQLCFNRSIYNYAPDTCTVQAFATQGATTASETVAVSAGSAGTSLGTIGTAQVTDSSDLNHLHRIGLGSNRWMTSVLRQWLNTDADGGTWWVPQTKWDRPPSYANYDGFLKGLDPDLVSAMREVRVVTAQSYSADGGTAASPATDVTYDRVFLPSWEQQYLAVSQNYGGSAGLEGSAWDYWKLAAGTASPRPASTSSNESTYTTAYVRYGMENHATARYSWLRSASRSHGSHAALVYSSGHCGTSYAHNGHFAAPACFIG